ncbi:hypothetical protein D3C81_1637210 [compost metagenome]
MASMTLMISTILREESLIEPMVLTTSETTTPPLLAICEASMASWLALRALSALSFTVDVSSSMDDAVSSSELACSSVRDDRSRLPAAISLDAVLIDSVPARTWPTILTSLSFMFFSACINCPVSSRLSTTIWLVRLPADTASATSTARVMGRVIERVIQYAQAMPSKMATTPSEISSRRPLS